MTAKAHYPSPWPLILAIVAVILLYLCLPGCTGPLIAVDKSVHVNANVSPGNLASVEIVTSAENTSSTKADGNTASAEAGLNIPLLP